LSKNKPDCSNCASKGLAFWLCHVLNSFYRQYRKTGTKSPDAGAMNINVKQSIWLLIDLDLFVSCFRYGICDDEACYHRYYKG